MALSVPIGCARAFQVTMGILDLIGCARPAGPDMIGCLHLLDMAVMMGQCTLRQIRDTGSTRHVSMTPTQTARQPGQQAVFFVAGGVQSSHGQTSEGFLVLENAPDLWAATNSWALVLALTVQSCVTELIVNMGHKGRVPLSCQGSRRPQSGWN